RHFLPAGSLPDLERAHLPAKAPADRKIDVARVVGDGGEMIGAVMKKIAKNGPQELRLRVAACPQLGKLFRGVLKREDFSDTRIDLPRGGTVRQRRQIQHLYFLADLLKD